MENHAFTVLKGLRALVGEVVFNAAIDALRADKEPVVVAAPVEKKKRTRTITAEDKAKLSRNMAALQAFTKTVREELGEAGRTDAKRVAGERWKAMSKEDKEAWTVAHVDGSATSGEDASATVAAEKTVVVSAPDAEPKKGRGRPKKEAGAEVKVSKE